MENNDTLEVIQRIPLDKLRPYPDHPFGVRDDDMMQQTVESIKQFGVLVPGIARPLPDGTYELIAGHRRKQASAIAGLTDMPIIVRDIDRNAATIIMVDSNLQRENILPSEKAKAYKMKLEAIKRQAGRPGKNSAQVGQNLEGKSSRAQIAENSPDSFSQIQRYIRLNELEPELLQLVDEGKIGMTPAVEISYLKPDEQRLLIETIDSEQATPSFSQAQRMRRLSGEGKLNEDTILGIMLEQKKPENWNLTLPMEKIRKYFPRSYTPQRMEETIMVFTISVGASLSLFIPYQSRYDSEGDVRRALGLVNKRVLTVERAVIRWKGMLANPAAMIDADECVLNTSATPATMTDEEAEYAGNRNVAWNVNLLLFLHRTGFIDLLDASYVFDKKSNPPKKYYTVTIKLLQPDVLSDDDSLTAALTEPRAREYEAQMAGYRIMSELVSSPKSLCWGRVFRHLFPLSREVCNGCPADPEGRITSDDTYKLRMNPDIKIPPARPSRRLDRNMGSFNEMIISRPSNGPCSVEEVAVIAEKASQNGIGVLVVPNRLASQIVYDGILLNYDEFYYAVAHCPYFFAKGVVCIFDSDTGTNFSLYKNLGKLDHIFEIQFLDDFYN